MSIPIITVIVPLFNEKEYLDRCMNSLQAQTHRRLQIILVNGGSTDGTAEACDTWASRWNMGRNSNIGIVEVIHTSNDGVSASRNLGLAHASGELVTFLDGDDYLEPDMLKTLYGIMEENDVDMVGCDFISRYPDGEEPAADTFSPLKNASSEELEILTPHDFLQEHILHADMHVWGRLYKRSVIGNLKFDRSLTIGEDMLFLIDYVRKCKKVAHTHYAGYDYYRNPRGVMLKPFTGAAMDQVRCWEEAKLKLACEDDALGTSDDLKANMLIAIMLTASRLACLDSRIRREGKNRDYASSLRAKVKEYGSHAAMKKLDRGYRTKVRLFRLFPGLYMALYHRHKAQK